MFLCWLILVLITHGAKVPLYVFLFAKGSPKHYTESIIYTFRVDDKQMSLLRIITQSIYDMYYHQPTSQD